MSGAGIGLVIKIAADTRQAVGDIKGVNKALGDTGTSAGEASGFIKGMKGPALGALGAVAGAAIGAAAAMVEFGKAAWEDQQEANKLARVLETIPGITQDMIDANEEWITQTMFATHVLDTDLRQAISDLTLVTGDLTTAQNYAVASANLATVADVEYATAVAAVEKALAGKTTSLMKMAPWLDTNKDGSLSLAEAQAILTNETLEGKAAAAAADDPWTTLNIAWDETKEALGRAVLPLLTRLSDWLKDPVNQAKLQRFIDRIADLAYEFGVSLMPYLDRFLKWLTSPEGQASIKRWAGYISSFAKAVGSIANAIAKVIEWWNKIPDPLKKILPGGWLQSIVTGSAAAAPAGLAPQTTAATMSRGVTVNFYGTVTDPESTARSIEAILAGSSRRNSHARSWEPAW